VLTIELPDGEAAFLAFRRDTASKTIAIVDMKVPLRLRGQGLGTKLVRELHDYALAGGYSCAAADDTVRPFLTAILAKKGNEALKDCICAAPAKAGSAAAGGTC